MTRIAYVRYLNTAPLVEGLDKLAGVSLTAAAPSHIVGMVMRGRADLGLVSLIDAAREDLAIVPCGMIGCDGPTLTVSLYSSVPIQQIARVHVDSESHTSGVLCRVVLSERGVEPKFVEYNAREKTTGAESPQTVLLIGDKVVTDVPSPERYPHRLDLGQAWHEMTGLPFVYAAWMCKADRADDPEIIAAAAVLGRQLLHNRTRIDWIVRERAPRFGWPIGLAAEYLGSRLRYELDDRARAGAELFVQKAAELGVVRRSELRWAQTPALV